MASNETWLSLSKAADRLNIHPTTLRRWADSGEIPVMVTPGGHRRFAISDLDGFAADRHGVRSVSGLEQMWADEALSHTRQELTSLRDEGWLARIDDESRARHRLLGQQLMGLTLRYLSDDNGDTLLQEASQIGVEYANIALTSDMPLTEALRASMFFRDTLVETALQLPENVHIKAEASLQLLRRINTLLNAVQLAIAEVFDANLRDSLPGS